MEDKDTRKKVNFMFYLLYVKVNTNIPVV